MKNTARSAQEIVELILSDYGKGRDIDRLEPACGIDKSAVVELVGKLLEIIYPGYFGCGHHRVYDPKSDLTQRIGDVTNTLSQQIALALTSDSGWLGKGGEDAKQFADDLTLAFLKTMPRVRELAQSDVQAAFDADPAACSKAEVIFSYPGIFAITVYRLAHELHALGVPMIPRIMTEYAHSLTGIDIHPGATIADHFFIDHGTGVVIGETTVIGAHVRVYQGVTLGALTTRGGQHLRGERRHPTIEDDVTIYAGASILGGQTVIGQGCVIGSNAFLTASVEPNTAIRGQCPCSGKP